MTPEAPIPLGPIAAAPTSTTAFVGASSAVPHAVASTVTDLAEAGAVLGENALAEPLGRALSLFFANGGSRAVVVPTDGLPGPLDLAALGGKGASVLVLPGVTAVDDEAVRGALAWCSAYAAVLVLDLPLGEWSASRPALALIAQHRDRVAVFHPWLVVGTEDQPPSAAVAGVMARVDRLHGVWTAASGTRGQLHGIDALTMELGRRELEVMTQAAVNGLRQIPGEGHMVWGARVLGATESAEPAGRYLPVRRLTDHVLRSLTAGLTPLSGPSDEALWAQIRARAEEFLLTPWRAGALAGQKSEEASFVRCGLGQTMTDADVAAGEVVVLVGLAVLKPAEFEVHRLRLPVEAVETVGLVSPEELVEKLGLAFPVEPVERVPLPAPAWGARMSKTLPVIDLERVVSPHLAVRNSARLLRKLEAAQLGLMLDEADALFDQRAVVNAAVPSARLGEWT